MASSLQTKAVESFPDMLKADSPEEIATPHSDTEAISGADQAEQEKELQRIKKVGEDFEALFFSMMLKVMRESISSEADSGLFAGEGSDTYGGMFDTFIGQHMATTGQLGLADLIVHSMMSKRTGEQTSDQAQEGNDSSSRT